MNKDYNKEGGAAFPAQAPIDSWGDARQGMTLREYYAGQALKALVPIPIWQHDDDNLANRCYQIADAMLKTGKVKNE